MLMCSCELMLRFSGFFSWHRNSHVASTRVWNFLWQPHRAASWTPKSKNGRLCWKVPVSVLMWGWAHVRRNLNGGQAHVKCQFVEAWGRLWLGKQITINVDLQGFAEVFHSWRFTFFHLMTTNFKVKETIKKRKQRHALCLWKNCKDQQHRCVMYAKFQGETFRLFFSPRVMRTGSSPVF